MVGGLTYIVVTSYGRSTHKPRTLCKTIVTNLVIYKVTIFLHQALETDFIISFLLRDNFKSYQRHANLKKTDFLE